MAKPPTNNAKSTVDPAKARIQAQAIVMRQTRNASAAAGMNALQGIYKSLASTTRGAAATLSADNMRRMAALGRITTQNTKRVQGVVSGAQEGNINRYGSAMGHLSSEQLKPAKAQAKEAVTLDAAGGKLGKMTSVAADQAMQIAEAGVKTSKASAKYAMAEALMYRAKNDAATIAQEQTALALQHAQLADAEALAKYNYNLQNNGPGGKVGTLLSAVNTNSATMPYSSALNALRDSEAAAGVKPGSAADQTAIASLQALYPDWRTNPAGYGTPVSNQFTPDLQQAVRDEVDKAITSNQPLDALALRTTLVGAGVTDPALLAFAMQRAQAQYAALKGGGALPTVAGMTGAAPTGSTLIGPGRVPNYGG